MSTAIDTLLSRSSDVCGGQYWVRVLNWDINATGLYSGRPDFEAAVPLAQAAADVLLLVDNSPGFNTGVAVGNASSQAGTLTLTFRDENGAVVAQSPLALAANGHSAFVLKTLMPATDLRRGVLEIVAPAGITVSAVGIRAQDSGALTTLPVLPR